MQGNLNASATAYRTGLLHAPNAYFMSSTSQNDEFCLEGALLHGNLSVVLAHQQLWSSCLESVLTALELHLNVTNIQNCSNNSPVIRLKTRFDQCCKHLNLPTLIEWNSTLTSYKLLEIHTKLISLLNENKNNVKNHWDIPTPKYDHNLLYHGLSNGVRIDTNHEKGRHIIATESFEPGDIIAVEPAGGWAANRNAHSYDNDNNDRNTFEYLLLLPSQRMNQCLKCFNQLNSVGFVCPYCCDAAYCELSNRTGCNSYCAKISNPSYLFRDFQQPAWHLAECRFMFLLNSIGLGHLCFRLAWLRQRYHHPSSDEIINENNSYFTTDQLIEHFTNFHVDELFEYALTGWLISKLLSYNSNNDNNKTNSQSTNNELIQGLWCFDTLRRLQCNAHAITEIQVSDPDIQTWLPSDQINVNDVNDRKLIYPLICKLQQIRIATGLFPCVSLLNHSCDPNTIHDFQNSYLILRCLKPILPNTEVFHCYGPHYLHYPSSVQRVTLLQQQYFFICHCEHCDKSVQSSSSSSSSTLSKDQQMSIVPTKEMLNSWKDAVDNLLQIPWQPIQSLENLKNSIQIIHNIATMNSTISWWPLDNNLGNLYNTLGRQYLIQSIFLKKHTKFNLKQTNWLFIQNIGLWCLYKSIQWVQLQFGIISCEYLWELINYFNLFIHCFNQLNTTTTTITPPPTITNTTIPTPATPLPLPTTTAMPITNTPPPTITTVTTTTTTTPTTNTTTPTPATPLPTTTVTTPSTSTTTTPTPATPPPLPTTTVTTPTTSTTTTNNNTALTTTNNTPTPPTTTTNTPPTTTLTTNTPPPTTPITTTPTNTNTTISNDNNNDTNNTNNSNDYFYEEFIKFNEELIKLQMDSIIFKDHESILSEIIHISTILYGSDKTHMIMNKFLHI
ncbi:unnamed protein product [Schistosoma margrebowiei]|uniref:SET domain-containing protein n=1 Tax=Schistosoma margrebowiei TaxID=48269 RepID=A0AA85ALZ4_9TREM|nr:unnamed protein product [Schistosoma margrebowiei]